MNDRKANEKRRAASYSTIGLMFPASIAVGLAVGYFLDRVFGTEPILLIVFTLEGVAAGFWNLIKVTKQDGKKRK